MPKFLFSYRMPNNYVPAGDEAMAAWSGWFDELGDRVIERGNPTFEASSLGNCGSDTHVGGYSFVTAEDLESAVTLAKGAPAIATGGGVEVGLITEIM